MFAAATTAATTDTKLFITSTGKTTENKLINLQREL